MHKEIKRQYKDAEVKAIKINRNGVMLLSFVVSVLVALFIFSFFVRITYAQESNSSMFVTPSSGVAPLTVNAHITANSQLLCTAFEIDWGDGTGKEFYDPSVYDTNCYGGLFDRIFTHTYATTTTTTSANTYTIRARAGSDSIDNLDEMSIPVLAYGSDYEFSGQTIEEGERCFISPNSGYSPLQTVAYVPLGGSDCDGDYTYYIDWGDGNNSDVRTCNNTANHYNTFNHTYATSSNFVAHIVREYDDNVYKEETCNVYVTDEPTITINKPTSDFKSNAVIDKPFNIEWSMQNIPASKDGIAPIVRLLFLTFDGQAGFIADTPITSTSYQWIPTTEPCLTGVCQSTIAEGEYYINASIIYDVCGGDPFCGQDTPTVASYTTELPIVVSYTGTPIESWLHSVSDRVFAFPFVTSAPGTINFTAVLNSDASCVGGVYVVEYGDGESTGLTFPSGKCAAFATSFSHIYTSSGVYTVKLYKNGIESMQIPIHITESSNISQEGFSNIAAAVVAFGDLLMRLFRY